jgi:hypothetical protein
MKRPPRQAPLEIPPRQAPPSDIAEIAAAKVAAAKVAAEIVASYGGPLVQTGLRLDAAMLERLRASKRGLSDEIRERLERTFAEDRIPPITQRMRDEILMLAEKLRADFGDWYASRRAHAEFVAAVTNLLARYEPLDDPPSDIDEPLGAVAKTRVRDLLRETPNEHLKQLEEKRKEKPREKSHV